VTSPRNSTIGTDMHVIAVDPNRKVCISGLDNHQVPDLDIITAGAHLQSQRGPVIGIFHGYACMPNGRTIHSSNQLEHYKLTVDDRPMKVGGTQCTTTPDGYAFPLNINDGLSYLQWCRTCTDEEFEKLPHVIMTSDVTWDPSILDCTISNDDKWHNTVLDLGRSTSNPFDEFGRYKQRQGTPIPLPVVGTPLRRAHPCQTSDIHYMITSTILEHVRKSSPTVTPQEHDFTALRLFFLWVVAPSLIAQTYKNTTQYAQCAPQLSHTLRDSYRSLFPPCNVRRRHEAVATDTISCNITAIGGITCIQQHPHDLAL
jgi:hypothetical protein